MLRCKGIARQTRNLFLPSSALRKYTNTPYKQYDVVIVGSGASALSAAIRLKQISKLNVCCIEKDENYAKYNHYAVRIDPKSLMELNFKDNLPFSKAKTKGAYFLENENKSRQFKLIEQLSNEGDYIGIYSKFCDLLNQFAKNENIDIYTETKAKEIVCGENNCVKGVSAIQKDGSPIDFYGKFTILADGCKGELSQEIINKHNLMKDRTPQKYSIELQEIWKCNSPDVFEEGSATYALGWPLDNNTFGRSYAYHFGENMIAIGLLIGLEYSNLTLDPYLELQRLKTHPLYKPMISNSVHQSNFVQVIPDGGEHCCPKLSFPGGILAGNAAGFHNVVTIKSVHTSMKSGILAADSIIEAFNNGKVEPNGIEEIYKKSWLREELHRERNVRAYFKKGNKWGLRFTYLDSILLKGKTCPWRYSYTQKDLDKRRVAPNKCKPIEYPPMAETTENGNIKHEIHKILKDFGKR